MFYPTGFIIYLSSTKIMISFFSKMCNHFLSYMTQNSRTLPDLLCKFSGATLLLKHQEIDNGTHFRKKWGPVITQGTVR